MTDHEKKLIESGNHLIDMDELLNDDIKNITIKARQLGMSSLMKSMWMWSIKCDAELNTPDVVANNELRARIIYSYE